MFLVLHTSLEVAMEEDAADSAEAREGWEARTVRTAVFQWTWAPSS